MLRRAEATRLKTARSLVLSVSCQIVKSLKSASTLVFTGAEACFFLRCLEISVKDCKAVLNLRFLDFFLPYIGVEKKLINFKIILPKYL